MSTINSVDDGFEDAKRGLEWLERLEALQSRSASERAAYEVAEYVMKLRAAITDLAGDRPIDELIASIGAEPLSWWRSCGQRESAMIGTRESALPS